MTALRGRYEASVLTAAITGGDVLPSQSPHIPCGADAIVAEAVAAAQAGATCIHIHARDDEGRPSADPALFEEIVSGIRDQTDVVVNISTGGAPGMSLDERLAGARRAQPEIATLNLGTMNYEGFPNRERWPEVASDWEREVLEASGDGVFVNTLNMLRQFASTLRELRITPELEAYDLSHIAMARFLVDEGALEPPIRLQLVLGVLGGAGNAPRDLHLLVDAAERILGDELGSVAVAGLGFPMQFRHAAIAFSSGLDCRVGLEDNIRLRRDAQATSNAELVGVAIDLADRVARPIMTPAALREELGPWAGKTEVAA